MKQAVIHWRDLLQKQSNASLVNSVHLIMIWCFQIRFLIFGPRDKISILNVASVYIISRASSGRFDLLQSRFVFKSRHAISLGLGTQLYKV